MLAGPAHCERECAVRKVAFPEAAKVQVSGLAAWFPGQVEVVSALTGRAQVQNHGPRLYRGSVRLAGQQGSDGQAVERFIHEITDGGVYFDLPVHRQGFAGAGATVGTGNAEGEITVSAVTNTGIRFSQDRAGAPADAVNGNLIENPVEGDYWTVGGQVFHFGPLSASATAPADDPNPLYELPADQLALLSVGDVVGPFETISARLDGEPPASISTPDWFEAYDFDWVQHQPPVRASVDRPPQELGHLPDINVPVGGDAVPVRLGHTWATADGRTDAAVLQHEFEVIGDGIRVTKAGQTLNVRALVRDSFLVRVWARDLRNGIRSEVQAFRVNGYIRAGEVVNPSIVQTVPPMSLAVGEEVEVNRAAHFSDAGQLTFPEVVSPNPDAFTYRFDGEAMFVKGVGPGDGQGAIIAVNPQGGANSIQWPIVVSGIRAGLVCAEGPELNEPPKKLADFPRVVLRVSESEADRQSDEFDIRQYAEVANQPPTYVPTDVVDSASNRKITESEVEGHILTISSRLKSELAGASFPLTGEVSLLVRDAQGRPLTLPIQTEVTDRNRAPEWKGRNYIEVPNEAGAKVSVDLLEVDATHPYAEDPDGDELTLDITSSGLGVTGALAGQITAALRADGRTLDITRVRAVDSALYSGGLKVRVTDDGSPAMSADIDLLVSLAGAAPPDEGTVTWNRANLPPDNPSSQAWNIALDAPASGRRRVDVSSALTITPSSATITKWVESRDESIVKASFVGDILHLDPQSEGLTTILLAARGPADTEDQTLTLRINITPASVPEGYWSGPTSSDLALVLGTPKTITPDDYFLLPSGAVAAGVKVAYTRIYLASGSAYAALREVGGSADVSEINIAATDTANDRKFILRPKAVAPDDDQPRLVMVARQDRGRRRLHTVNVAFPVTAAAQEPPGPDQGPQWSAIPNFPTTGSIYPRIAFTIPFERYVSPGPRGVAIDWPSIELRVDVSAGGGAGFDKASAPRVRFTGYRSRAQAYACRVRVADRNRVWSAWQDFTILVSPLPFAPAPVIAAIPTIHIQSGEAERDIRLKDHITYTGAGGISALRFGITSVTPPAANYAFSGIGTADPVLTIRRAGASAFIMDYELSVSVGGQSSTLRSRSFRVTFGF